MIERGTVATGAADVAVFEAAILIGVAEHGADGDTVFRSTGAVHGEALDVGTRAGIGIAEGVLHVEAGIVLEDDAGVGPEPAFVPVGELVGDTVDADGAGLEAAGWGALLLIAGIPVYVAMRRTGKGVSKHL